MNVITVEDLQAHLNLPEGQDSDLLASKIASAETQINSFLEKKFADYYDDASQANSVPEPLKEAVRQLAAHYYEQREAVLIGASAAIVPWGVVDLIQPYRAWAF